MRFLAFSASCLALFQLLPGRADDKSPMPPAKKYVDAGGMQGKLEKINPAASELTIALQIPQGRYSRTERKELALADDMKVWFVRPPERTDEDGTAKKLTPAELDKIKSKYGPTKGLYAGELADLRPGQQIRVALGKPKDAIKKPTSKEKGVAPEKEFIYVTTVVVMVDEKPTAQPDKKK